MSTDPWKQNCRDDGIPPEKYKNPDFGPCSSFALISRFGTLRERGWGCDGVCVIPKQNGSQTRTRCLGLLKVNQSFIKAFAIRDNGRFKRTQIPFLTTLFSLLRLFTQCTSRARHSHRGTMVKERGELKSDAIVSILFADLSL